MYTFFFIFHFLSLSRACKNLCWMCTMLQKMLRYFVEQRYKRMRDKWWTIKGTLLLLMSIWVGKTGRAQKTEHDCVWKKRKKSVCKNIWKVCARFHFETYAVNACQQIALCLIRTVSSTRKLFCVEFFKTLIDISIHFRFCKEYLKGRREIDVWAFSRTHARTLKHPSSTRVLIHMDVYGVFASTNT